MSSIQPTVFSVSLGDSFEGFGVNSITDNGLVLSNYLTNMSLNWSRLHLKSNDPGPDGIGYTNQQFDDLWTNSDDVTNGNTRFTFSALQAAQTKIILTIDSENSFLPNNGKNELIGDSLTAFARYWASAIKVHLDLGLTIEWVDLCENIDSLTPVSTYISPSNFVVLCTIFKQILVSRGITGIKIFGPNVKVPIKSQFNSQYIVSFLNTSPGIIDAWSLNCMEITSDQLYYNTGDFNSRMYMYNQVSRIISQMRATLILPVYISKFSTRATKYSLGADYGPVASEVTEFAIRLVDNMCGLLSLGVSNVMFWHIFKKFDRYSLYGNNGNKRPQKELLELLSHSMSTKGKTFTTSTFPTGDETIKALIVDNNTFTLVLSRPILTDTYNSKAFIEINNPLWNATNYNVTVSFYIFPSYISTVGIRYNTTVNGGVLRLHLNMLPYNCVIFAKGALYDYSLF